LRARLQLAHGARVEERGLGGREQRHRLALLHDVAGFEAHALDAPGERRGDDVAVAHARLAVVGNGLLEKPVRHLGGLDRHRARLQRPGDERAHHHGEGCEGDLVAGLHSRVFSTPTRSRLSMRLRTMSALTMPAPTTTAPA
jgi:hypothetical protein